MIFRESFHVIVLDNKLHEKTYLEGCSLVGRVGRLWFLALPCHHERRNMRMVHEPEWGGTVHQEYSLECSDQNGSSSMLLVVLSGKMLEKHLQDSEK